MHSQQSGSIRLLQRPGTHPYSQASSQGPQRYVNRCQMILNHACKMITHLFFVPPCIVMISNIRRRSGAPGYPCAIDRIKLVTMLLRFDVRICTTRRQLTLPYNPLDSLWKVWRFYAYRMCSSASPVLADFLVMLQLVSHAVAGLV